jgi:hypothetical protein
MELKVTKQTGSGITIKRQEYALTVYPFDTGIRGIQSSLIQAKGDLIVGLSAGSAGRLPVGAAGQSLTPDSGETSGLKWVAGAGSSVSTLTNKSGVQLNPGDVVILHATEDRSVNRTTVWCDMAVCGVVQEAIANDASGAVATFAGHIVVVNCDATAVVKGDYLVTSTTAGKATSNSTIFRASAFAKALTAKGTGVGTVYAMLLNIDPVPNNPGLFSDMLMWLKAESLAGYADTAPIDTWTDSSPAASNVTASSTTRPLAAINSINGLPSALFDGSNDVMVRATACWTGAQARTVFSVAKRNALSAAQHAVWGQGTTSTNYYRFYLSLGTGALRDGELRFYSSTIGLDGVTNDDLITKIHCATYDGAAAAVYKNRGLLGSGNFTLNTDAGVFQVGGLATFFDGNIAEIIVYNKCLSEAERNAVFGYLGAKFGVTLV